MLTAQHIMCIVVNMMKTTDHTSYAKIYETRKGYEICVIETGKRVELSTIYPTREAAEAVFDKLVGAHLAAVEKRRAEREQRDAKVAASLASEPTTEPMCTERQAAYIESLLQHRARTGEGGGFVPTERFYVNGRVDRAAVTRLTRAAASNLITSLKSDY